jgi:transcriptional regulator with XRE-family HTH domain
MTTSINMPGAVPQFTVSDRVRKAREYAGMQQGELAAAAGMARSGVARIESGKGGRPRRSSLIAIAFATGVNLAWLETGKPPAG